MASHTQTTCNAWYDGENRHVLPSLDIVCNTSGHNGCKVLNLHVWTDYVVQRVFSEMGTPIFWTGSVTFEFSRAAFALRNCLNGDQFRVVRFQKWESEMDFSRKLTMKMTVYVELISCSLCVNVYCHRVTTQLQLINKFVYIYIYIYIYIYKHRPFGGTYCFQLQGTVISHAQLWQSQRGILFCPEDRGGFFFPPKHW